MRKKKEKKQNYPFDDDDDDDDDDDEWSQLIMDMIHDVYSFPYFMDMNDNCRFQWDP